MNSWENDVNNTITVDDANAVSRRIHYESRVITGRKEEIEGLFIDDKTLNLDILYELSESWGTDVNTLLTSKLSELVDEERISIEWNDKYFFVVARSIYNFEVEIQKMYKGNPWRNLFSSEERKKNKRYDINSIMRRVDNTLVEIEKDIPGTIHQNSQKKNISFTTEYVFSFPDAVNMINSYCDMYLRYRELFIKIGNGVCLSDKERKEFNYIATALWIRDINGNPSSIIYAGLAKELISCYKTRGLVSPEEVFNRCIVINFASSNTCDFCRCIEFINNKELVQRYLSVFPREISVMRNFISKLKNFSVSFLWDDQEPTYMTKEEFENLSIIERSAIELVYSDIEGTCGVDFFPVKDSPESIELLIKKNDEELDCAREIINQIDGFLRPEKLGGIKRHYLQEQFKDLDIISFAKLYSSIKSRGLIYG